MNSQMIKMAVKMIGRDNINNAINQFAAAITAKISEIPLMPGETDTAIMIWKDGQTTFATICAMDTGPENPVIKRQIETINLTEYIAEQLNTL